MTKGEIQARRTTPLRHAKRGLEVAMFSAFRLAAARGIDTRRYDGVIPEAVYAPWKVDVEFEKTTEAVATNTVVDRYRLWELWTLVQQLKSVPGDILEVGVWRGGSGCLMATRSQLDGSSSTVYLCDTFEGVVKASSRDTTYVGGEFADTPQRIVEDLAAGLSLKNVVVRKGIFPDDTGEDLATTTLKLCHVDVDTHDSAKAVTEWAWKQLVPGGILVYDDYGFWDTPGVTEFVDSQRGREDRRVFHNLNGHALIVKV